MNAIGYRRLSERDQSKYSLEYQDSAINDYCKKNNLNLIGVYTDNGQSSYTFDRPDYKALETFIKQHKGKAQYLIIMDHDRFSRNLPEALTKITELETKFNIKVLATNEAVDIDPTDPAVFIQRAFSYLMANQELFRIRKRTRDGIRQAQLSGRFVNNAPFGYKNARDERDKAILIVDEEKAPVIQKIFADYLDGTPAFLIYKEVKKLGFANAGNSAITRVLSNPVYAGFIKVTATKKEPEKLTRGLHQAIISEADYWLVQEKLGLKRPSKSQPKEEFPLRGILKCWCGKSMTAGFSKGKNKYYLYYRCTVHHNINIPGKELHDKFDQLLDTLSFTESQVKKIAEEAKSFLKESTKNSENVLSERTKQLSEVNKKVDKLEERLMNDEIDGTTYKKWVQKYSTERALIAEAIHSASQGLGSSKWQRIELLLPRLTSMREIYHIASLQGKQTLIKAVFKHNLVYNKGAFRTPSIEPAFIPNSLKAKEKGLLDLEQPYEIWDKVPFCSP